MTPSAEKARSKSSGESPPRGSDIDNDLGTTTSAVPSRRRRIRSRVAFARPIGDVRGIVDRAETRRERPRAREVTRDARVR